MCGIAGYLAHGAHRPQEGNERILSMVRPLAVRGPDDEGVALFDPDTGSSLYLRTEQTDRQAARGLPQLESTPPFPHRVALAHRRFSIIDPGPAGHQPFVSADGSVCLIFNGEIYNYLELRQELIGRGRILRTRCDTEVLAEAFLEWGTDCFSRFDGFWAIALYDRRRRALLLARDRMGKAPLYLAAQDGALLFASEIASLQAAAVRPFAPREQAISDFVAFGLRDLHDLTFYDGVRTFPRASFSWVGRHGELEPQRYWEIPPRRLSERELPPQQAAAALRDALAQALRLRLRADVPLGIHLSGGLDSSALVGLAAASGQRLQAYHVSYPGTPADEEPYARAVAARFPGQVELHTLSPPDAAFFAHADSYVADMQEPFHSPSMLAARLVWAEMAGRGLRVSIDGGAADELFAGYVAHYYGPYLAWLAARGRLRRLEREVRALSELPAPPLGALHRARLRGAARAAVGRRLGRGGAAAVPAAARALLVGAPAPVQRPRADLEDLLRENATGWLMNYWLRSSHQNFMHVPLEVRSPFLDHRVVELAFRLPVSYLIRDGWLKWILRQAVAEILPSEVVFRRQKMGFPFPMDRWLQSNRERFWRALGEDPETRCPLIDHAVLAREYQALSASDPMLLWRAMAVALWWRRCVAGAPLEAEEKTEWEAKAEAG